MPVLDRKGLTELMDMDQLQQDVIDVAAETVSVTEDEDEAVRILKQNIEKANVLLDKCIAEMNNGNFSARLVEVSSLLVNSVTTASGQILAHQDAQQGLQIKESMIRLKSKEVLIREKYLSGKEAKEGSGTNQQLVITDRETILKFLQDKNEKKEVKQVVSTQPRLEDTDDAK